MPVNGFVKREPLDRRVKVQFTAVQEMQLMAKAEAVAMTVSGYMRALALADIDPSECLKPAQSRSQAAMLQVAEFHALAMQVKRLGTNVNQLARQANAGMVPVTRAEANYLLNQHQVLMSHAKAVLEKLLA